MMLEHPDITKALRTGHPIGWKEPEPICCPICGAENPDTLYRFRDDHEWFGCSECIWNTLQSIDFWDVDEEMKETM